MNLVQNFFGQNNMYFLGGNQKSARNFYFRPKFGHLKKFKFGILGLFSKILTLEVARRPKVWAFCPNFFSARKICILYPQTKNRPKIFISGRNLAIWKIYSFCILGLFFKNFDFGSGRRAENWDVLSEIFFGQK